MIASLVASLIEDLLAGRHRSLERKLDYDIRLRRNSPVGETQPSLVPLLFVAPLFFYFLSFWGLEGFDGIL